MQEENNFLLKLVNNIIEIFNKLFNLCFILAICLFLSEVRNDMILKGIVIILYSLLLCYIIYCSYRLSIKKDKQSKIRDHVGFVLCILLSAILLGSTFSATFLLNMLSSNL